MQTVISIVLILIAGSAFAQQAPADAFSRGFMRGQQIRQAAEQRRLRAEEQRQKQELAEFNAAYTSPFLVLKSRHGLPAIILSDKNVSRCEGGAGPAFTRDANGDPIYGCARATDTELIVEWEGYGPRIYTLTEWEETEPSDPDEKPLGSP